MSTRQERRAAAKAVKPVPNVSGTKESCGNCRFACRREINRKVVDAIALVELAQGRPAPQHLPDDETFCLRYPQQIGKKIWGWCGEWRE